MEQQDEVLQIKVAIADRLYPITIPLSQEEAVRKSAAKVRELIKSIEKRYAALGGKQDALAMASLELAVELDYYVRLLEDYDKKMESELSVLEGELKGELNNTLELE